MKIQMIPQAFLLACKDTHHCDKIYKMVCSRTSFILLPVEIYICFILAEFVLIPIIFLLSFLFNTPHQGQLPIILGFVCVQLAIHLTVPACRMVFSYPQILLAELTRKVNALGLRIYSLQESTATFQIRQDLNSLASSPSVDNSIILANKISANILKTKVSLIEAGNLINEIEKLSEQAIYLKFTNQQKLEIATTFHNAKVNIVIFNNHKSEFESLDFSKLQEVVEQNYIQSLSILPLLGSVHLLDSFMEESRSY